jgi:hypothetical protein
MSSTFASSLSPRKIGRLIQDAFATFGRDPYEFAEAQCITPPSKGFDPTESFGVIDHEGEEALDRALQARDELTVAIDRLADHLYGPASTKDKASEWIDSIPRDVAAFVVLPSGEKCSVIPSEGVGEDDTHPTYAPILLCAAVNAQDNFDIASMLIERLDRT